MSADILLYWKKAVCVNFYLKDGIEIASEFIFPGEMAVSFNSFLRQKPSREYIQAPESCKVQMIPFSLLKLTLNHQFKEYARNQNSWLQKKNRLGFY